MTSITQKLLSPFSLKLSKIEAKRRPYFLCDTWSSPDSSLTHVLFEMVLFSKRHTVLFPKTLYWLHFSEQKQFSKSKLWRKNSIEKRKLDSWVFQLTTGFWVLPFFEACVKSQRQ